MATITTTLTNEYTHHAVAKALYSSICDRTSNTYMFFGRVTPWENEVNPPEPQREFYDEYEVRSGIVNISRIIPNDMSFVILRHDWTYGTKYDKYDPSYSATNPSINGAFSLYDAKMFVFTSENNIYKCIDNNGGAPSIVMPNSTDTSGYITTSDGYVWKYMMTVDSLSRTKFLTTKYVPISSSLFGDIKDNNFEKNFSVVLNSGGSGYSKNTHITVTSNSGTGAILKPILTNGVITDVNMLSEGNGYTDARIEVIDPGDPSSGAVIVGPGAGANISGIFGNFNFQQPNIHVQLSAIDGDISSVELLNRGTGYTSATAKVVGDGTGATVELSLSKGTISNIKLTSRGKGYTRAEIVITGTGTGAQARAIVSPRGGHGHNIILESLSRTIGFNKTVQYEQNHNIDTTIGYRQTGIIINPDQYPIDERYRTRFSSDNGTSTWLVESSSITATDYSIGQMLRRKSDLTEYYVVAATDLKIALHSLENNRPYKDDVFLDVLGNEKFTVVEMLDMNTPDFDKYSGVIITCDNRIVFRDKQDSNVIMRTFIEL